MKCHKLFLFFVFIIFIFIQFINVNNIQIENMDNENLISQQILNKVTTKPKSSLENYKNENIKQLLKNMKL